MSKLLLVLLLLCAGLAHAQTVIPCPVSATYRCYWESQPCTAGSCSRTAAPTTTEFATKGISLKDMQGARLLLCAASGQTLTGTGTIHLWTWDPSIPSLTSSSPAQDLSVADAWSSSRCNASACQCVTFGDLQQAGNSGQKVIAEASGVGVTGGSAAALYWTGLPYFGM